MATRQVDVATSVLSDNDALARENRRRFAEAGVLAINLIAAPGAGKTSLILRTIEALGGRARVGVIEGDVASRKDTDAVLAGGAHRAVQINTDGGCHLEAAMVARVLDELGLDDLDVVVVENVGNLICPTHWNLGEHLKVCLVSTAEGDDKPVKYPEIFGVVDAVVLGKLDLIEHVDFDRSEFYDALRTLHPDGPVFELSSRTGAGVDAWADWIMAQRQTLTCGSRIRTLKE